MPVKEYEFDHKKLANVQSLLVKLWLFYLELYCVFYTLRLGP